MIHIRIIGDVHGRIEPRPKERSYRNAIERVTFSLQLGDLGLDYSALGVFNSLPPVDPSRHRVMAGNHDNYAELTPHFLGDFGVHRFPLVRGWLEFFFVRGARSIDRAFRIKGKDWWPTEELNPDQCQAALAAYSEACPQIVLSQDCPTEALPFFASIQAKLRPSRTNQLFQQMLFIHRPKLWISAHHHRSVRVERDGTIFISLGELAFFDLSLSGLAIVAPRRSAPKSRSVPTTRNSTGTTRLPKGHGLEFGHSFSGARRRLLPFHYRAGCGAHEQLGRAGDSIRGHSSADDARHAE